MYAITIPFMSLNQIYKSGQVFTWQRVTDDKYIIVDGSNVVKVEQRRENFLFSCSEEDFYNIWWKYFDLSTDYMNLNYVYRGLGSYFKICCVRTSGLRVLQQNLWQIIVCSVLETATSIERVRQMIEGICEKCGRKHKSSMREVGNVLWYEFPSPQQILKNIHKLTTKDIGYKIDILTELCENVIDGWLDLDLLSSMSHDDAVEYLMEFKGIGNKVAESICLFGLHYMDSFPLDTHMNQLLKREFNVGYEEWLEWYLCGEVQYIENMGYLREVLFYNELFPVNENNYDFSEVTIKKKGKRRRYG